MTERIHLSLKRVDAAHQALSILAMLFNANIAVVAINDKGHIGLMKNTEMSIEDLLKAVTEFSTGKPPLMMDSDGKLRSMVVDTSKLGTLEQEP